MTQPEPHDPDTIAIVWHVDDVFEVRPDLTREQAREVLATVRRRHDATIGVTWDVLTLAADDLFPPQAETAQDKLRTEHFRRLNAYHASAEYADYCREIGTTPPAEGLPSLIGDRWEIDRDLYEEFLEMLPPLGWTGGTFYMRESSFGDITAKFTKEGDQYFCEFAHYPARHADRVRAEGEQGRGRG